MTEPTDAELQALWSEAVLPDTVTKRLAFSFARAVLAKWGTPPAGAGEPVAWRYVPSKVWGKFVYTEDPKRAQYARDIGIDVQPIFTTPQPTQVQAGAVPMYRLLQSGVDRIEAADEFLSEDTTTWAIDPNGIFVGNIYGGHVLRPARRRIKGGQHGTE